MIDLFVGGPLDGTERMAKDVPAGTWFVDPETGTQYERWPAMDSENVRWWVPRGETAQAVSRIEMGPHPGEKFLTLAELRALVRVADAADTPEDAIVQATVSWTSKVTRLELRPPKG